MALRYRPVFVAVVAVGALVLLGSEGVRSAATAWVIGGLALAGVLVVMTAWQRLRRQR